MVAGTTWHREFARAAKYCSKHKDDYGGFRECMHAVLTRHKI